LEIRISQTKKLLLAAGLIVLAVNVVLTERLAAQLFPAYQISVPAGIKTGVVISDLLFVVVIISALIYRKSKTRILADGLIGLGVTVMVLFGMEMAFYYLNRRNERPVENVVFEFLNDVEGQEVKFEGEHAQAVFRRDDWLGYALAPHMRVKASRRGKGQILYDVVYSADAYGRRVAPLNDAAARPYFLLFFGDSFTFGEGVNDDETMPYYVAQLATQYKPYNYGLGGYGPQHMLARLQTEGIRAEVEEAEGILVYSFINEHISRAIGSMRIHHQRGDVMPYYTLDPHGELVRQGNLVSGRPWLSVVYNLAGYSQTLRYFNIDFPPRLRDQDLVTTVRILQEARDIYSQKFNSDRFVVLIYPGLGQPEILPYLKQVSIHYLDYSDLPQAYDHEFWLGEGHPAAKAHKIVAEKLVQDLDIVEEMVKIRE
jgi:hypothetical protein